MLYYCTYNSSLGPVDIAWCMFCFLSHTENLYEEPMKKDAIYMNVREAADEYMNTQRSTWTLVLGSIAIVIVMFGLGLGSSNYVMSLI